MSEPSKNNGPELFHKSAPGQKLWFVHFLGWVRQQISPCIEKDNKGEKKKKEKLHHKRGKTHLFG